MEKAKLLKYLGAVRDLEGHMYVHEQAIARLQNQYNDINRRVNNNSYERCRQHKGDDDTPPITMQESIKTSLGLFAVMAVCFGILAGILSPILATITYGFNVTTEQVGSMAIVLIGLAVILSFLFNAVMVKKRYDELRNGSEKWQEVETYNKGVMERNKAQRAWDAHQLQLIPQEIELLKSNKKQIWSLLYDFYHCNILHKDYQNLVAVCSIYQYIDSGRCMELHGPNGAYNLYEDEKFKRIVISKLDEIIQRLNQIQHTQRELYRVMCNCETKISELTQITKNIAQNITSIQDSAEITQYNTSYLKQNEEYRILLKGF